MRLSIKDFAVRFVRYSRLPNGRSRRTTVRVLYSTSSNGVAAWAIRHSVPQRSFTEDYLLPDNHAYTYRSNRRQRRADYKPVEGVLNVHAIEGIPPDREGERRQVLTSQAGAFWVEQWSSDTAEDMRGRCCNECKLFIRHKRHVALDRHLKSIF